MTKRWLVLLGVLAVAVPGAFRGAAAMPTDSRGASLAAYHGPAPDIRPFLADKVVPPEVLDPSRPGLSDFPRLGPQQGITKTFLIDDFEAPVINDQVWLRLYDLDVPPEELGEYYWALSRCQSNPTGGQSLWAVGGGVDGSNLSCGSYYPPGVASGAIMRLELARFESPGFLDLMWDFWLNTRTWEQDGVVPDGLFLIWLRPNPDTGQKDWITLDAITSEYPQRFFEKPRVINLLNAEDLYHPGTFYDLHAAGSVDLLLLFKTIRYPSRPIEFTEGTFIDNVRLQSDVDPLAGDTPTPTIEEPTVTPTPSEDTPTPSEETPTPSEETPTPSEDTPTPSEDTPTPVDDTPTPTATEVRPLPPVYLPIAYKEE